MPVLAHEHQRQHIATVMQVAADSAAAAQAEPPAHAHDPVIRASWRRCVHQHRLDPTRMQPAVILPQARLREHQDQMEALLQIARHGLESLYNQVAGLGYVVLLTDARGVTVDFIGDLLIEPSLRRAGLYLGADWSEHHAGTCGVGTCISTGEALTVHLDDHFDATHIPLTCTSAPVFSPTGELSAVLDISALSSPQPKASQHLALQLVKACAQQVENAQFLHRFRHDWVLRLAAAPQFLDVDPDYLLALDAAGRVIGHNRRAHRLFAGAGAAQQGLAVPSAIGQPLASLLALQPSELGRFMAGRRADQCAVQCQDRQRLLFLRATPPPALAPAANGRVAPRQPAALPAALSALSAGDAALERQLERAARLANSPISLLVTGETGSGKEYFAKAVHAASERRQQPFVAVNCAAIPEGLIESELFGHLPGSFTGAGARTKRGLIQEADGGTLFLDEIGDMALDLQARLLRVLAEREVLPVGASRPQPVNIRVIAATHCPLEALVRAGRFRDDLYYRLNGAHFQLPPLRQREDLGAMIDRLLTLVQQGTAATVSKTMLSADARALLLAHRWPGNLRELRNAMDYAHSVCHHGLILPADLPDAVLAATQPPAAQPWAAATVRDSAGPGQGSHGVDAAAELLAKLRQAHWNVSALARALGCSRMTLYRRMARLGIRSPNAQDGALATD